MAQSRSRQGSGRSLLMGGGEGDSVAPKALQGYPHASRPESPITFLCILYQTPVIP